MSYEPSGLPYLERLPGWEGRADAPALLASLAAFFRSVVPPDMAAVKRAIEPLLLRTRDPALGAPVRAALLALVDAARGRRFLTALEPRWIPDCLSVLLPVLQATDFTVADLLRSREREAGHFPALRTLAPRVQELSAATVARRTRSLAAGFRALLVDDEGRVAFLSENALETALCDLACLAHGIVDVPIPANSAADQVQYTLRHCEAHVLVVSNEAQLAKVLPARRDLPDLKAIVVSSRALAERHGLLCLDDLEERGARIPATELDGRSPRADDLATVMYTSGTTGTPKGIMFSHHNLVAKRLCRSLALPDLGPGDVLLSYLPLFHTFGRFFELLGALWSGASYVFARSPGLGTLLEDFATVHPSVFISVPQKWMELHQRAMQEAATEDPDRIADELRRLTGGHLRLGLSAAGYLDPLVFRAFRRAGVELCSGYGMTEATGGVTMTPPGEYVEGSIGRPLPGIETRIGADSELFLRGPYVMRGYFRPPDGDPGLDRDGWFATGDLIVTDERGHFRLTGRKKEIYKNRKGQTIAPQRVENLFRDFDAVGQAFLVGDGRELNTLLIWPNYDEQPALRAKSPDELRSLLGSLVASANRFLAPYERVIDFALLDRPLSQAHGEVTPKGTFRRDVVERAFRSLIDPMYQRAEAHVDLAGVELRMPNWLLREIGVLREDLSLGDGWVRARGRTLRVEAVPGALRLGDFVYSGRKTLDLGAIVGTPALALGNEGLRMFVGEESFFALLSGRRGNLREAVLDVREAPAPKKRRAQILVPRVESHEVTIESLHAAAVLLRGNRVAARLAIQHLERGAALGGEAAAVCRALLRRGAGAQDERVRRRAFRALLPIEEPKAVLPTVERFLESAGLALLQERDLARISERGLPDELVEALLVPVREHAQAVDQIADPAVRRSLIGLMRLLSAYVVAHPAWYPRLRIKLARLTLHADAEIGARAGEELDRLQLGFRAWLGPNLRLAVDPESGHEYGWRQAMTFDASVPEAHRALLSRAVAETSLVREAVFLFGRGVLLTLADLPPGGVRVSRLGSERGEALYRLSLQPRSGEDFEVALHVAEAVPVLELREEIRWLLTSGAPPPLVQSFGGYFPEYGVYTAELVPGETVEQQLARVAAMGAVGRLRALWPFLGWTAFAVHVAFWDRTGRRLALTNPSASGVIAPSHDYQVGARLLSLWCRGSCARADELVTRFETSFVAPVEAAYPALRGGVERTVLLSALLEVLGEARGVPLLESVRDGPLAADIDRFLDTVRVSGFTPQRVWFSSSRYSRWIAVNPAATPEARGAMLRELWDTYHLEEAERTWPDTRVRFFRHTVFADARPELSGALDRLMHEARARHLGAPELSELVAALRSSVRPTAEEDYFLARLAYRHLAPGDDAALITLPHGGKTLTDVVVSLADSEGRRFSVRSPISAREVARLLQLFHDASLPVTFGSEHEYLVAVDEKGVVLGGIYYRIVGAERAHLDKIAVARPHRKKGVSDGLMQEFMRRLRERGVRTLETGFFHPEYLRRFGFRTEPHSGGLFQDLRQGSVRLG